MGEGPGGLLVVVVVGGGRRGGGRGDVKKRFVDELESTNVPRDSHCAG